MTLPNLIEQKEAILFDLFHTLTGLESTWYSGPKTADLLGITREAWSEQLMEKSRERLAGEQQDPLDILRTMAHAVDPTIPEETIKKAVANRIERFAAALLNIPRETQQVLERLKSMNKKLGLISNADVTEVAAWERSPLAPCFDSVVFSCHVGCVKPEPEIYRVSMESLQVSPAQCVFVGDGGSNELQGARELGITTVMITGVIRELWPERVEERRPHADYVIERLGELTG